MPDATELRVGFFEQAAGGIWERGCENHVMKEQEKGRAVGVTATNWREDVKELDVETCRSIGMSIVQSKKLN